MSRSLGLITVGAALVLLEGCHRNAATNDLTFGIEPPQGRYIGVGIYSPGAAWARVTPGRAGREGLGDDQAIIVVTDSRSGEIRACGDLSGYCLAMNPWAVASRRAPIELTPLPEQRSAHRRRRAVEHQDAPIYPSSRPSLAAPSWSSG